MPLNVVLFNPDEWRAGCAGCCGDPVVRTPHLDRLAAEGVRFDQCHAQHPVCTPSRTSLMTGWYPHVHGHRTLWHMLRPDEPNLLRSLTRAGYDVRWYGKNDLLAPESFAGSVTEAVDYRGTGHSDVNPWSRNDPRYYSFLYEPGGDPRDTGDFANLSAGLAFLRAPHDRPFCLYLPLGLPHPPYTAPQPFHSMYDPRELPPLRPPREAGFPRFYTAIRESRRLGDVGDDVFQRIRAIYLGMVSFSDWLLGELLQTLDETGLAETTAVFVYSDHGDWAGDYGLVEKWPSALDDAMTRVPFVARVPGGVRGHVVCDVTELFDLTPTVLELVGVQAEHTHFARSLVPQLHGAAGEPARAAFAEGGYDPHEPRCFEGHEGGEQFLRDPSHIYWPKANLQQRDAFSVCRSTMLRTATHKLIRRPLDVSELYDLRADPMELHNLYDAPDYASTRRDLEARLLAWYIHTADVTPWREDPRVMPVMVG